MPFVELNAEFTEDMLVDLMPPSKTDRFFEALFGDASEGSYDISLKYKSSAPQKLEFEFHLTPKPGKCLACNLTYGLPTVFARHPVIDIKGMVVKIAQRLDDRVKVDRWYCGETVERTPDLHIIPLVLEVTGPAP